MLAVCPSTCSVTSVTRPSKAVVAAVARDFDVAGSGVGMACRTRLSRRSSRVSKSLSRPRYRSTSMVATVAARVSRSRVTVSVRSTNAPVALLARASSSRAAVSTRTVNNSSNRPIRLLDRFGNFGCASSQYRICVAYFCRERAGQCIAMRRYGLGHFADPALDRPHDVVTPIRHRIGDFDRVTLQPLMDAVGCGFPTFHQRPRAAGRARSRFQPSSSKPALRSR